jgi:hypothetical protein
MTTMSTTTPTAEWMPEPLLPSTDMLLRLRRLEAQVQALEVAVRSLTDALDRTDDHTPANLIRKLIAEFRL